LDGCIVANNPTIKPYNYPTSYNEYREDAMKKAVAALLVVILVAGCASPGYCGPFRKLKRGICNLLTFPCEVPNRMYKAGSELGPSLDRIGYGIFTGIAMTGLRLLAGVWETFSFPIAIPENYEPIVTDPEFFIFGEESENKDAPAAKA
jgi:putative exosortase-associated protein (TIGR04073 family)